MKAIVDFIINYKNYFIAISTIATISFATFRLFHELVKYIETIRINNIQKDQQARDGIPSYYTANEISSSLRYYIEPDCAQADPANETDLQRVAEVREPIMKVVRRFIERGGERRHILLLADSGMGKTTFALSLYNEISKNIKKDSFKCAVIPLGRESAEDSIKSIKDPTNTILILDAFDEDASAAENNNGRIQELMAASSDFAAVIITCRSQFFPDDAAVPNETGVSVIGPRRAGQVSSYRFYRLYLLPFTPRQIKKYLNKHFPIWNFIRKNEAKRLVREIPELSIRPMLLALVPDLAASKSTITELFDLYEFMVDQWLDRESKWIDKNKLLSISKELAVYMHIQQQGGSQTDRVSPVVLHNIASDIDGDPDQWKHLKSRSLLNRDSAGNFKFAHRTIMEYLFVVSAIEGNQYCFTRPWTNFMKELFLSWGHSHGTVKDISRACEILGSDLRRTKILPLNAPLQTPRVISSFDLAKNFSQERRDSKKQRSVPIQWRSTGIQIQKSGELVEVIDLNHDLSWKVIATNEMSDDSYRNTYKSTIADLSKLDNGVWRPPSSDEFMSLLDAEKILGAGNFIDRNQYYWLGDKLGKARYVVAALSQDVHHDSRLKVIETKRTSNLNIPVWLYELKRVTSGSKERGQFSAMCALVAPGIAEDLWHEQVDGSKQILSSTPPAT